MSVRLRQSRARGRSALAGRTCRQVGRTAARAGFTAAELLVVIAILVVVFLIVVPAFKSATRDVELQRARADIFAALNAARSRAIRERTLVALHIFRDAAPVYLAQPVAGDPHSSDSQRWGGLAHTPTGKITLRIEVPDEQATNWNVQNGSVNAVQFRWPADHEPLVMPDFVGIARPMTKLDEQIQVPGNPPAEPGGVINFYEDFYIVFAEDGRLTTVLVDYDLSDTSVVKTEDSDDPNTYSASGLCIYDVAKFKSLPDDGDESIDEVNDGDDLNVEDRFAYINRSDNRVIISPYTGLPFKLEQSP